MSLKARLILSFTVMIGLTALFGATFIAASWRLRRQYVQFERNNDAMRQMLECRQTFGRLRRALDNYLLGVETERERFYVLEMECRKLLAGWNQGSEEVAERKQRAELAQRFKSLQAALVHVMELAERQKRTEAIRVMDAALSLSLDAFAQDLQSLANAKRKEMEGYWDSIKLFSRRMTLFSFFLLLAVLLLGSGFSILLYRSISHPLAKLREGAREIGAGHWQLKLDLESPAELAELARAFEEMAASLTQLQGRIAQMDRMSTVGTLAGGVAHEINNPLTGVLGQAQILMEKLSPDDPNRFHVQRIETAAQRCRKIVRGLLDFSRPSDYLIEPEEVEPLIRTVLGLCDTEMKALGIQTALRMEPSLPRIAASSSHLQQVFLNLLTNAMQAMPKGGTLEISASRLKPEADAPPVPGSQAAAQGQAFVQIAFRDNGAGIAAEHLPHIFKPFFTTKEPGQGTGLGLSISYGIVQRHGGSIEVRSEGKGQGSTAIVRLPAAGEESAVPRFREEGKTTENI